MNTRLLPNLIIGGVTKAGTTSLYSFLRQSDEVYCPDQKETNYYVPLVYGDHVESLDSYARYYAQASTEAWRLDASPFYFTGAQRIGPAVKNDLASPRLIIALRDPVERLWSAYTYQRSQGRRVESFSDYLDVCFEEYESQRDLLPGHHEELELRTGRYANYLSNWFDALGSASVKIVFMEDVRENPRGVARTLFQWLGVTDVAACIDTEARNVTQQPRSQLLKNVTMWANEHFRGRVPRDSRRYTLAREAYVRLSAANSRAFEEVMNFSDRERVVNFYRDSNRDTKAILSVFGYADLPAWLAHA